MSSDGSPPDKKLSLATVLLNAVNQPKEHKTLSPVPSQEIDQFQDFYGLAANALWDFFLTGHVEEENRLNFDHFFLVMPDCYWIGICSGTFEEKDNPADENRHLVVNQSEWKKEDHSLIHDFLADLQDIIKEHGLSGIVLEDREEMFSIQANNPYCLLRLIEVYIKKFDILTLDELQPREPKQIRGKITSDDVKNTADTLRNAASHSWGTTDFTVKSGEHIDIRHFPTSVAPSIDTADIMLIEAQLIEETVPFSLQLLRNTYRDCFGIMPKENCGLTLLH